MNLGFDPICRYCRLIIGVRYYCYHNDVVVAIVESERFDGGIDKQAPGDARSVVDTSKFR